MEILKSSLKQVPENERVKGRVYGTSDILEGELTGADIFKCDNRCATGTRWKYWFEIPESMLPVREVEVMPEFGREYEFSDDGVKWYKGTLRSFRDSGDEWHCIRPIQFNPAQTLSIPAGTKAEQLEYLRSVIATLEGGGV